MDAASLDRSPALIAGAESGVRPEDLRHLVAELSAEIHALERRVDALEHYGVPFPPPLPTKPRPAPAGIDAQASADTIPALGRALLGFAGAYLLRALTEMSILPRTAGITLGILYAAAWLFLAARSRRSFTQGLNAATSLAILAPLIWEASVRLHAIPAAIAAAVVAVFCALAMVLARTARTSADATLVATIAAPACAWIALILLVGTEAMLPFSAAILAIAALSELARISTRGVAAIAADIAVLLMIWLLGRGGPLPDGYAAVPLRAAVFAAALLAVIYVLAALRATLIEGRRFSIFSISQTAAAFLLGLGGTWYLTHSAAPIGWTALAAGIACYALLPRAGQGRNLYAYAVFALALTCAGIGLLASGAALASLLCAAAMAVFLIDPGKLGSYSAAAFLWIAALAEPHWLSIVFAAALIVYVLLVRLREERWSALAVAAAMVFAFSSAIIGDARLGSAATAILTVASPVLAWFGARQSRKELVWMMYVTMAAAAWMLVARDLASDVTLRLVFSLLLFGVTLMLLPRILKSVRH